MYADALTASAARLAPFILLAYALSILLEMATQAFLKRQLYDLDDTLNNLLMFFANRMTGGIAGAMMFSTLAFCQRIAPWHFSGWTNILLTFIFVDFLYYFQHWCFHSNLLLAAFHDVHHTSERYNLSTALRASIFLPLVNPFFYIPAVLLGCDSLTVMLCFTVIQVYQFFLHSELIPSVGKFEGILNTASAHRVHHGREPSQFTKNLGGILLIWDQLFKTYRSEDTTVLFGMKGMPVEHNYFVAQIQPFQAFMKRWRSARKKRVPPLHKSPSGNWHGVRSRTKSRYQKFSRFPGI